MSNIDLKQLSEPFELNANEFAEKMGYSRQALHAALRTGEVNDRRMLTALENMKAISNKMYLNQLNEADKAKKRRELVLASLAKWFGLVWD